MAAGDSHPDYMKPVEALNGKGELAGRGETFGGVPYEITRYQAMTPAGLPVPGLHRIEGSLDLSTAPDLEALVGADLKLTLENGRTLALTLISADGRVLAEGHGPSKCQCC